MSLPRVGQDVRILRSTSDGIPDIEQMLGGIYPIERIEYLDGVTNLIINGWAFGEAEVESASNSVAKNPLPEKQGITPTLDDLRDRAMNGPKDKRQECVVHGAQHQFVVPVEWEYVYGTLPAPADQVILTKDRTRRRVTKLRCACGQETER